MAYRGGLSFNLADVIIPNEKAELVEEGYNQVEEIQQSFNMGLITKQRAVQPDHRYLDHHQLASDQHGGPRTSRPTSRDSILSS